MMTYPSLEFDLDFLPPGEMTLPYIVGAAIEGGSSLSGITNASDVTGGGLWAIEYSNVRLGNVNPARMRYWMRLSTALAGGIRPIVVPFFVDFMQPGGGPILTPFSDSSTFSDESEFSQPAFSGPIATAAVGAGTVAITVPSSPALQGGEFFGVLHPTKLQRVYQITDIDSAVVSGSNTIYTVGIRPTLREALAGTETADFSTPNCLMRLAPGQTVKTSVKPYWWATPSISFIEYFGP